MNKKQKDQMKKKVFEYVSHDRYAHSVSTAETAESIAIANKLGAKVSNQAYVAGLLHDIMREKDDEYCKAELITRRIKISHITNPREYHGFLGAEIAKEEFGITDEEILKVIRWHDSVQSKKDIQLYKIVYISDKHEPTRSWYQPRFVEKAKSNIDEAFRDLMKYNVNYALDKYKGLNKEMQIAKRFYKLDEE